MSWKLEQLSIGETHKNITFGVSGNFYLFMFFDYYFKFSIALLYYELEKFNTIHINTHLKVSDDICDRFSKSFSEVVIKSFPDVFEIVVSNIVEFSKFRLYGACDGRRLSKESQVYQEYLVEQIKQQLDYHGIYVDIKKSKTLGWIKINGKPKNKIS